MKVWINKPNKLQCLMHMIIAIVLIFAVTVEPVPVHAQSKVGVWELSQLTDQEALAELLKSGLELPAAYDKNDPYTAEVVKRILLAYRDGAYGPDHIPYSYTELVKLAQNVYKVIDVPDIVIQSTPIENLQDSTVIGSWSSSYLGYNCYGYAISTNDNKNPGYYSNQTYSASLSISQIADLIIADLDVLGYSAIKTTTKPSSIPSGEYLIAVRKGADDYHVMKADTSASIWKHKPSISQPLFWNYTTPGYKVWTNEHSRNGYNYAGEITYNSTIYYIRYWSRAGGRSLTHIQ